MIEALSAHKLKPKLSSNACGDLFITIHVGSSELTKPLPQMETLQEAAEYINKLVPQMAKELYRKIRNRKKRSARNGA